VYKAKLICRCGYTMTKKFSHGITEKEFFSWTPNKKCPDCLSKDWLVIEDYEEKKERREYDAEELAKKDENKDKKDIHFEQKYSWNGILAESVLIGNKPFFLVSTNGNITFQEQINPFEGITIKPLQPISYINKPYRLDSTHKLDAFIEQAKSETLDSLYKKAKSIWSKYINADEFHIKLCAADTVFTYFQDKLGLTHYLFFIGKPGSGKSNNLTVFQQLAYRNMTSSDITPANIYQFLGSNDEGVGTLCEDEADNIDSSGEKMRIYKNGYTTGRPILRIDTAFRRVQMKFNTFCFKAFAGERLPDSTLANGFNERIIPIHCTTAVPVYDILEILNPSNEVKFQKLQDELMELRNLLLVYRLLHYNEKIPDIETDLENREKQLFKPLLRLFDKSESLTELKPVIMGFVNERRKENNSTLYAFLYNMIIELIKENEENEKIENKNEVSSGRIWTRLMADLEGEQYSKQSYNSVSFGSISQKDVIRIYKEVFGAKASGDTKNRGLVFDMNKLDRIGSTYAHAALVGSVGLEKYAN